MTRIGLSLLAVFALSACGSPEPAGSGAGVLAAYAKGEMADFEATDEGAAPPELALVGADGQDQTLAGLMGERATLVNLWATWCAPCVVEMPALNELQADYGGEGLAVVAINLDGEAQKGVDFYAQNELTALGFHHDPDLVAPSLMGTPSLPLTVIYDAAGQEIGRTWGAPDWVSPDGRALIEAALASGGS